MGGAQAWFSQWLQPDITSRPGPFAQVRQPASALQFQNRVVLVHLLASANILPFSGIILFPATSPFCGFSSGVPPSTKPSLMSHTEEGQVAPLESPVPTLLTLGCYYLDMDWEPQGDRARAVSIPAVPALPNTGLSRGAQRVLLITGPDHCGQVVIKELAKERVV